MDHNPYSVSEQPAFDNGLQGPEFEAAIRAMKIIAGALIMGVLVFLGIVLVITKGEIGGMENADILTIIAAGFGFLMIVNHLVIPRVISGAQLKLAAEKGLADQDEVAKAKQVCGVYQAQMIVGFALLEGAAFFNLIVLMLEKSVASLGVVILLLSLMAIRFPTRDKVSFWVQNKLSELSFR